MAYCSFEELDVWKRACRLAVEVCQIMSTSKAFFLPDQMQRAALSIPSNIAEGAERDSKLDYIRFLRIAKGSAAELRTQAYIAARLKFIEPNTANKISSECKEIASMLQGLIRSMHLPKSAKP